MVLDSAQLRLPPSRIPTSHTTDILLLEEQRKEVQEFSCFLSLQIAQWCSSQLVSRREPDFQRPPPLKSYTSLVNICHSRNLPGGYATKHALQQKGNHLEHSHLAKPQCWRSGPQRHKNTQQLSFAFASPPSLLHGMPTRVMHNLPVNSFTRKYAAPIPFKWLKWKMLI